MPFDLVSSLVIAVFGLYMLGYNTPFMPQSLNAMIKWNAPLPVIRVLGLLLFAAGLTLLFTAIFP